MEVDGSVWKVMENFGSYGSIGSRWKLMEVDESVWKLMEVFGSKRNFLEVYGSRWRLMEVFEN